MKFTERQRDLILRTVRLAGSGEEAAWSRRWDVATEIRESHDPAHACGWKAGDLMDAAADHLVARRCKDLVGDAEKLDDMQACAILTEILEYASAPRASGSHLTLRIQEEANRNAWTKVTRGLLRRLWHEAAEEEKR